MWARVDKGAVAEVTAIDPVGRFHPSIKWLACGDDVRAEWTYDGHAFAPPVAVIEPLPGRSQVEAHRLRAYADPLLGSDRYFAEAQRESLMGNAEAAEAAKALGLARFFEIQAQYPWPPGADAQPAP